MVKLWFSYSKMTGYIREEIWNGQVQEWDMMEEHSCAQHW